MAHFGEMKEDSELFTSAKDLFTLHGHLVILQTDAAREPIRCAAPAARLMVSETMLVPVAVLERIFICAWFPGQGSHMCLKNQMLSLEFMNAALDIFLHIGVLQHSFMEAPDLLSFVTKVSNLIGEGGHRVRFEAISRDANCIETFTTPILGARQTSDDPAWFDHAWDNLYATNLLGSDLCFGARQVLLLWLLGFRKGAGDQVSYVTNLKVLS